MAGLGYFAYLGAIEFSIRQESRLQFEQWTSHLKAMDPDNPDDPEFYSAVYYLLPGNLQTEAGQPTQHRVDSEYASIGDVATHFRNSDLLQVCLRNHGELNLKAGG